MIQHSICDAVVKQVFVPAPVCTCDGMKAIAEALDQSETTEAAVWRLITASVILKDEAVKEQARRKYQATVKAWTSLWGLHASPAARERVRESLNTFLVESLLVWSKLMTYRERIVVCRSGGSDLFDTEADVEENPLKVPGHFAGSERAAPVLCLFPAFVYSPPSSRGVARTVLKKGFALYDSSPTLVQAHRETEAVSSPKSPRRMI